MVKVVEYDTPNGKRYMSYNTDFVPDDKFDEFFSRVTRGESISGFIDLGEKEYILLRSIVEKLREEGK